MSPSGLSSNPGTSALPTSIFTALSGSLLQPGDTAVLKAGTYAFVGDCSSDGYCGYDVNVSGTALKPITFRAETPGTVNIMGGWDGRGYQGASSTIYFRGTNGSYTNWEGITFSRGWGRGVWIEAATNVKFTNCRFTENQAGAQVDNGINIKFYSCEFFHNFTAGFNLGAGYDNVTGKVYLKDCVAHDNGPEYSLGSLDPNDPSNLNTDGFYASVNNVSGSFVCENCTAYGHHDFGFDISADFVITRSKSYGNSSGGFKFWIDGLLENSLAINNGEVSSSDAGVSVSDKYRVPAEGTARPGSPVVLIQGVTIAFNGYKGIRPMGDVTLRNSIIAFNYINVRPGDIQTATPLDDDYNLWIGSSGRMTGYTDYEVYSGKGIHSVVADPLFANSITMDYHLRAGSPAIDKGTNTLSYVKDYDGTLRPQGAGYDMGAYEFK